MKKTRAAGGGRKPLTTTEPTVKVAITLLPSQVEAMKQLGDGNLSAGIRKAIEMNAQTTTVTVKFVAQSGHAWEEEIAIDELETVVEQQVEVHGDIQVAYTIDENGSADKTLYRME